jgi:hypothetical protein
MEMNLMLLFWAGLAIGAVVFFVVGVLVGALVL